MARALFDPSKGYYTANVGTVGRRGHFSTSATASTLLAQGIARWIKSQIQKPAPAIIEVGGGDGSLMHDLRRTLGWWQSRRYQWHMVEVSPVLQLKQREKLGTSVTWHQQLHSALDECNGNALIYHNELVDAFPVRLLQWSAVDSQWQEIHLQQEQPTWKETLLPFPPSDIPFTPLSVTPPAQPRQRIELHESYHQWLHSWAPHWKNGAMLTIDYGDLFPAIYHRRPTGTLRAYLHHQTLTGPELYLNMGRQDITSDVNFSDLIAWGNSLGWQAEPLLTQREFLLPVASKKPSAADAFLLEEFGAGTAFKVLVQKAGPSSF
ncbi:SAM-dependent methyltransferase [Phragmitibacter flavus]|nr:SAM-dependent methyltransferase [Phragmitibacter flavus]